MTLAQRIASKVVIELCGQHALQCNVDDVAEIIARELEGSDLVAALRAIERSLLSQVKYVADDIQAAGHNSDALERVHKALEAIGAQDAK